MSVNRREFLKVSASSAAAAFGAGGACCWGKHELHVRLRGLLLVQEFDEKAVVHVVDSGKLGIHNHRPVLKIRKSDLELKAGDLDPSRKNDVGDSKETWEWDLAGKQIRFHEEEPASETLVKDTSQPTLPNPGDGGVWKSTLLIPDLQKLSGATQMKRFDASALQITLKDGRLESDEPNLTTGKYVVWTFKNPQSSQVVFEQAFSDTLLYRCPLAWGECPVIRVDSGTITLKSPESTFISIENMMQPPPVSGPNDPFTLGHFSAFYQLVQDAKEPIVSATPPSRQQCPKCDVRPFYCPPARIRG
jgi:hypothetical protein